MRLKTRTATRFDTAYIDAQVKAHDEAVALFDGYAGVTVEALREYETTSPDHDFDVEVAHRVGEALERPEAVLPNSTTGQT